MEDNPLGREYERHRGAVMAMLGKRFPRFDEDERLSIYHDAWTRVLAKRERGEEIESLRAYLLATCAAEALHVVSRPRPTLTVGPDEPLFTSLPDEGASVEDQVVIKDQARLARNLIDSLEGRQRDVLKLRWDLQLNGGEVRAALGLTRRQYQRISEQSAAEIAKRVEELEDGTWSRRQRSLLIACLVRVTTDGETREGIASAGQRREAQRLLDSDPHFAALFAEVRSVLGRAAAILPLPVLLGAPDASATSQVAGALGDARERVADLLSAGKQQATALYVRAADPTLFAGARPGTLVATAAGCLAVGGGAFGAYDAVSKPPPGPVAATTIDRPVRPIATSPLPTTTTVKRLRQPAAKPHPRHREKPLAPAPPSPPASPTPTPITPTAPATPNPQPTQADSEFGFEN